MGSRAFGGPAVDRSPSTRDHSCATVWRLLAVAQQQDASSSLKVECWKIQLHSFMEQRFSFGGSRKSLRKDDCERQRGAVLPAPRPSPPLPARAEGSSLLLPGDVCPYPCLKLLLERNFVSLIATGIVYSPRRDQQVFAISCFVLLLPYLFST